MEEIVDEYLKVNKYQTPINEELKNSVSREVWNDLMEIIGSIEFIKFLIQPEEKRGYAKDRPKDENGKVIVELTRPHILENMDFFRERAIYFENHKQYTHLRPNPNPNSEYAKFWQEEQRRWKYGLVRESDGEWIPGGYYFYLNYSPIWLNEEVVQKNKTSKVKGIRKRDFPKFWLGDYLFFHYLDQARELGAHAKCLKTRGIGMSYKFGSLSPRNMYVEPGLPNFHLASDKTFLDGEKGVYGKVLDVLDWIADNTPLPKMRLVNSPRAREVQLGYQDEFGVKKGLKSSVYGISLKDNPDKARGVRGPLIHYEEDGLFPNLEKAWNINRKAVEDGDIVYGQMVCAGCVCAGTKVWTKDGRFINVEDLKQQDGIFGFDNDIVPEVITNINPPSKKECYKISTPYRSLNCSYDHPILCRVKHSKRNGKYNENEPRTFWYSKEWKLAKDIKKTDVILVANEIDVWGKTKLFDPRLVGMLIGDGSYGMRKHYNKIEYKTPSFSNCDNELVKYVLDNYECNIELQRLTKDGRLYHEISIRGLIPKLKEIGIAGQSKDKKRLPTNYMDLTKQDAALMIAGLFDTDGTIQARRNEPCKISITQSSEELLIQLKYLLEKFGIVSTIRKVNPTIRPDRKDKNPWYTLNIGSKESFLNFKKYIPIAIKYKIDNLDRAIAIQMETNWRVLNLFENIREERVSNVENIGINDIYNLTTDATHTYLANNIITHNTGGVEGSNFEGSEKLFRNPLAYNIYGIPNVFDKNSSGETLCGFFWGAYLNRAKCYDPINGEPDVIKALVEVLKDRVIVKYNSSDPQAITQKCAEEPITPSDAVMRTSGTIFPITDLKDYLASIKVQGQRFYDTHYVGDLVLTTNGVEWKPNNELYPIHKFPTGSDKPEGAIEIFEMPKTDQNGKIDRNRYILGADPIDDDYSGTTSLASTFVFDLYTDRIVAEYTGRPKFANDYYEITRRMCMLYNGKLCYENNRKGLYPYFDLKRSIYMLCETPQILRDMDYVKGSSYGNKSLGINATATINSWGRRLQKDWLLTDAYNQDYDAEGNQVGQKLNMHTIRSTAYIEELIAWNGDINADRVSAMGMLMIYRADRLKFLSNTSSEEEEEKDDYINENYKNAFSNDNSYEQDDSWI